MQRRCPPCGNHWTLARGSPRGSPSRGQGLSGSQRQRCPSRWGRGECLQIRCEAGGWRRQSLACQFPGWPCLVGRKSTSDSNLAPFTSSTNSFSDDYVVGRAGSTWYDMMEGKGSVHTIAKIPPSPKHLGEIEQSVLQAEEGVARQGIRNLQGLCLLQFSGAAELSREI